MPNITIPASDWAALLADLELLRGKLTGFDTSVGQLNYDQPAVDNMWYAI